MRKEGEGEDAVRRLVSLFVLALAIMIAVPQAVAIGRRGLCPARGSTFSRWRPYKNPGRLIKVGMSKGSVLAIAGKADLDDEYYNTTSLNLIRVTEWHYIKSPSAGRGARVETTRLIFFNGVLRCIVTKIT